MTREPPPPLTHSLRTGHKISVPKKGKDPLKPTNQGDIMITSTVGKVCKQTCHPLRTVPKGLSPNMATLCLTKAIAEAKDTMQLLHVIKLKLKINLFDP